MCKINNNLKQDVGGWDRICWSSSFCLQLHSRHKNSTGKMCNSSCSSLHTSLKIKLSQVIIHSHDMSMLSSNEPLLSYKLQSEDNKVLYMWHNICSPSKLCPKDNSSKASILVHVAKLNNWIPNRGKKQ